MASGSDAWLDERRSWGIVSAVAASVVAAMSLIDLDEVLLRDVVTVIAAVGVYLVYGAVPRFPAWAPFGVACRRHDHDEPAGAANRRRDVLRGTGACHTWR